MKTILLLGAGGNAGINFTKSIKLENPSIRIIGVDLDIYNIISSNADEKIILKFNSIEDKIEKINNLIDEFNVDFVHAQPDSEVKFLCEHGHKLNTKCFNHNIEMWNLLNNKLKCQQIWSEKLNLHFESYTLKEVIKNPELFNRIKSKSGKVWFRSIKGAGSKASLPLTNLDEAISWANYWIKNKNANEDDFMLCEFLNGNEYAVQSFWFNGELVHMQARERIEYFFGKIMPSGQSSTPSVAKTVSDIDVYDTAKMVITTIDKTPHGIYCVDMKKNSKGKIIPTEINYGRFFTTSDFFSTIGINTPAVYVKTSINKFLDKKDISINKIRESMYWIRGLDKVPYKISESDLKNIKN